MIIAMLHIVLLILKIIGIVLGVLVGVLLLAIGLVLFVPVRYRIEATRTEGEGNPPVEAKARITWLLHFINVRVFYPAEVYLKARVLFFTVYRFPPKEKKAKKEKVAAGTKQKNKSNVEKEKKFAEDSHTTTYENKADEKKSQSSENVENKNHTEADREEEQVRDEPPKLSIKEKIIKIKEIFQNIWYTLKRICDRIKSVFENFEYYLDVLKSDTFKQAYSLCKDEISSVLSYIKPRKLEADLIIGMDDPAATGQILSYYGILYPIVGHHVTVVGDFDKKRLEGSLLVVGKIKIFTLIKAAIRIYFNKDIRALLKLFNKEDR